MSLPLPSINHRPWSTRAKKRRPHGLFQSHRPRAPRDRLLLLPGRLTGCIGALSMEPPSRASPARPSPMRGPPVILLVPSCILVPPPSRSLV